MQVFMSTLHVCGGWLVDAYVHEHFVCVYVWWEIKHKCMNTCVCCVHVWWDVGLVVALCALSLLKTNYCHDTVNLDTTL